MDKSPVILKGSKSGIELTLIRNGFPGSAGGCKREFSSGSHFFGNRTGGLIFLKAGIFQKMKRPASFRPFMPTQIWMLCALLIR